MQVAIVCNSAFGTDGISMFVLNNHRFFQHRDTTCHLIYSSIHSAQEVIDRYVQDWRRNGDKVQFISKEHGIGEYIKELCVYLKKEKIDVLHVHGSSAAILLETFIAKLSGVKKVVTHSHNTRGNHNTAHKILRPLVNLLADEKLACGYSAGLWMYGKQHTFTVIPNCIETSLYTFDESVRSKIRKEFGIRDNQIVLGHVGTFTEVKNQFFLLRLLEALKKEEKSVYKLLLIGYGPLKETLMKECEKLRLCDDVLFLGNRNDVPQLMMAMDVFCMPSLFEGFPIVAVEAQASGLPSLLSNNISSEICLTDLVKFLPIDSGVTAWVEAIEKNVTIFERRFLYAQRIKDAGYDIYHSAQLLEEIYFS